VWVGSGLVASRFSVTLSVTLSVTPLSQGSRAHLGLFALLLPPTIILILNIITVAVVQLKRHDNAVLLSLEGPLASGGTLGRNGDFNPRRLAGHPLQIHAEDEQGLGQNVVLGQLGWVGMGLVLYILRTSRLALRSPHLLSPLLPRLLLIIAPPLLVENLLQRLGLPLDLGQNFWEARQESLLVVGLPDYLRLAVAELLDTRDGLEERERMQV